jgi:hypothetical protein
MLARIFHESLAATTDMAVLRCRLLRRTVQVRLETNTLRLPGGTPIFTVSRQQFMKYPGLRYFEFSDDWWKIETNSENSRIC